MLFFVVNILLQSEEIEVVKALDVKTLPKKSSQHRMHKVVDLCCHSSELTFGLFRDVKVDITCLSDHMFLHVVFLSKQEMELFMQHMSIYYIICSVTG